MAADLFLILTSSSERIGLEILSYLPYQDQIALVSTNHFNYQQWIRKIRCFALKGPLSELFFINEDYRREILSKIENPIKQLSLLDYPLTESFYKEEEETYCIEDIGESFHCSGGLHRLETDLELFDYLMNQTDRCGIQNIEHLIMVWNDSTQNNVLLKASQLVMVSTSLCLTAVKFRESLDHCLSSSLTELNLYQCERVGGDEEEIGTFSLPPLPNLKKLSITDTQIENLEQFYYVKELCLEQVSIPNLEPFQHVQNLNIKNCVQIVDVSCLQQNCGSITIENCPNIVDYSPCFIRSESIAIGLPDGAHKSRKVRIDSSAYPSTSSSTSLSLTLKDVSLKGLSLDIRFNEFSLIKTIKLLDCDNVKCLLGLEEVESVYLSNLRDLTSLEGLGRNKDVKVERCHAITDFSSVRTVHRVLIAECEGFRNANDVAEVYDLTILKCSQLSDISVLGKVHSLTVESCPEIRSIISLVGLVPKLSVEKCSKVRKYERVRFDLTKRSLKNTNGLAMIPDSLYDLIFEFLHYEERIRCIQSSPYLHEVLMKKTRQIKIAGDAFELFFSDASFMNEILDYIENPLEQVQLHISESTRYRQRPINIRRDFYCPGYQKLDVSSVVFKDLCQGNCQRSCMKSSTAFDSENDWKVSHLKILGGLWPIGSLEDIQQYLYKALISLSVETKDGATSLDNLSPSLEELEIRQSEETVIMLPCLPKLRILKIRGCTVLNLADFHFLQELLLIDVLIVNVEPFKEIKYICFIRCHGLQDISYLQSNESVCIKDCWLLRDFRNAFSQSKEITIEWAELAQGDLLIDLSNFQYAETITVRTEILTATQRITTSRGLPASLREIVLSGDVRFDSSFCGFHGLERVELECCLFPSLERFGLGNVQEVKLFQLPDLLSLEGLQDDESGSLRSVRIISCKQIEDFSPLKYVHTVSIEDCSNLFDVSDLDHVHSLHLENCPNVSDISALKNVAELSIYDCNRVNPFQYRKLKALINEEEEE